MYSTLIVLCLYQPSFAQTGEESSGDIAYTIPKGWIGQTYPDGIVYVSPVFNTGEKCVLTIFQIQPTSGNLQNDASNVFREVFHTDPFQTARAHIRRSPWEESLTHFHEVSD
jgi:hypothetical protein